MAATARGTMSSHVERTLRTIFKRCVQCPPEGPTCPTCPGQQICSLVPQDCHTCAHMTCIPNPSPAPPSSGTNVGAIAGGVVGGVAFVAFVVFLVYWFWIKKRREEQDAELEEEWQNDDITSQKRTTRFTSMHDAASTRTRGSLANSILSRASNIIQIAYIPGVTNRNGGSGRNSIHAPVPPIPAAHRGGSQPPKSPLSHEGDALFFRPGDLRDSTWSGASSIASGNRDTRYSNNRDTRYTMASISPSLMRDSVASEVFFDDAASQPMPAATASRAVGARMVSVKSNSSSEAPGSTHTSVTPEEEGKVKMLQVLMPGQGSGLSPNPSVTSSSSSTFPKPKQITVGGKGRFPVRATSDASASSSIKHAPAVSSPLAEQDEEPAETEEDRAKASLIKNMDFATPPAVQHPDSPFFDASEAPPRSGSTSPKPNPYASMASTVSTSTDGPARRVSRSLNRLSAVAEEQKRASQEVSDAEGKRDASPFSDDHATE